MSLADDIRKIDYNSLDISEYNRRYIQRLLPALDYYMDIYTRTLQRLTSSVKRPASDIILVDYGGGHGFFSLTAKRYGIGRVIYVDMNEQSCATVKAVGQRLGNEPDEVICGDSQVLREWCSSHDVRPDALAGMDVIEHIYRLEPFFDDLFALNPQIAMVFTTASNPRNPLIRSRLHRVMTSDEWGGHGKVGFIAMRRQHLEKLFPQMGPDELTEWSLRTRGLMLNDLAEGVAKGCKAPLDGYNTCDPTTGSWTERLLPLDDYRLLLQPYTNQISIRQGFYNTRRKGPKGWASRMMNALLRLPNSMPLAPFIFIEINTL